MPNQSIDSLRVNPIRETRPLDILLVEDSVEDARLVEMIIREADPSCNLHVTRDAVEALDFLHRRNRYSGAPVPQLIVLDWSLPRESGDTVLSAIKADSHLGMIPVVVLSSSTVDQHILRGYELQASCWVVKGTDLEQGRTRLRALIDFWSHTAEVPRGGGSVSRPERPNWV